MQMIEDNNIPANNQLRLLATILNYNLSFGILAVGSVLIFLPMGIYIVQAVITIAAILFSPYLLFVLKKENRKGWIYFFIIIVIIPLIITGSLCILNSFSIVFLFIPLALFYIYCYLLRFSVIEWEADLRAKKAYLLEKKRREEQNDNFMSNFK
jgi:hypothetical protein